MDFEAVCSCECVDQAPSVELLQAPAPVAKQPPPTARSLTVLAGRTKSGERERESLHIEAGEIVCVVGPTGSGKSRLLADIECLAQGDTPSGRRVLIDGAAPQTESRYAAHRKLVAQLSQNMNFVVDLSVGEFIVMHAQCRQVADPAGVAREAIACANDLAGEKITAHASLTELSGGQTRALMIADIALISASPIVLIDEIENAGIDRRRALDLLTSSDKIVVVSTHDPILALMGDRRAVVRHGAVAAILKTSTQERAHLARLQEIDRAMLDLRDRLRGGERIGELSGVLRETARWMR
jgi:ABC-type lipoprotein export system ATPase subunit